MQFEEVLRIWTESRMTVRRRTPPTCLLGSQICGLSIQTAMVCSMVRKIRETAALQLRAASRGLELTEEVAAYLLRRCPRDLVTLFALLDQLDTASLAAQRRLTIPFVRQFI